MPRFRTAENLDFEVEGGPDGRGPYLWQLYRDGAHLLAAGTARNRLTLAWPLWRVSRLAARERGGAR